MERRPEGSAAVCSGCGPRPCGGRLRVELRPPRASGRGSAGNRLGIELTAWAEVCPRPLVLFFDEIGALRGANLMSVLSRLRNAYDTRPGRAPWSVILCGLRDVRDYRTASGADPERLGSSSPFNVKIESLRLGDFGAADVASLFGQYTAESGQPFAHDAVSRACELSAGQPWLVNALAREVVEKLGLPLTEAITPEHVDAAKERLILARATHLDSPVARLHEPRVQQAIEPMLAGAMVVGDLYDDNFAYVRDLGIVARDPPLRMANPIYREVVVRVLGDGVANNFTIEPRPFVQADGRLDLERLFNDFAAFWRENGEVLSGALPYHEVAPQLVLMAFLQRVVNGGGFVEREYGVGRGRIDLLVCWPLAGKTPLEWQREAIELKVWRAGRPDPLVDGLLQLETYLERLGLDRGVLVVFDRRGAGVGETAVEEAVTATRRAVRVWRM